MYCIYSMYILWTWYYHGSIEFNWWLVLELDFTGNSILFFFCCDRFFKDVASLGFTQLNLGIWPRNSGFLEISGEFTPVDLDGKLCWPRPVGPVALRLSFRLKAGQFLQFRCKNRFLGDLLLQCWDPLKYRMNIFPMVDIKSTILSKEV